MVYSKKLLSINTLVSWARGQPYRFIDLIFSPQQSTQYLPGAASGYRFQYGYSTPQPLVVGYSLIDPFHNIFLDVLVSLGSR